MARKDLTHHPRPAAPSQPSAPAPAGPPEEVVRLTNRTALFTFVAAFAVVLGLAVLARAWAAGTPLPVRLAAVLPLLGAAAAIVYVRRLRATLRAARQGRGSLARPTPPSVDGEHARA